MALDLEQIKARLAAATPGAWKNIGSGVNQDAEWWYSVEDMGGLWAHYKAGIYCRTEGDANFVANAPADLALLINEVETLRAVLTELVYLKDNKPADYEERKPQAWAMARAVLPPPFEPVDYDYPVMFAELREKFGKYFDGIDAEQYMCDLRDEEG